MRKKLMFILAILFIASSVFAMKVYLTNTSGSGQAQANPNASLGGYRSTTELSAISMKNLFDNVSIWEALLGDVEYRMIDIYNDGATDALRVQFYMRTPTSSPKTELNFGYSATAQPHADAWNGEALADESTAPASPAMTFANYTKTAPVALGTIAAGKSARICVRRTVTAGAGGWTAQDLGSFGLRWGSGACVDSGPFLVYQNFETTCEACTTCAEDNSETWTDTVGSGGAVDEDDATATILRGSQELKVDPGSASSTSYTAFTNQDTVYFFFLIKVTDATPSSSTTILRLLTNDGVTASASVSLSTSGRWVINHGTHAHIGATLTAADNTKYYVWGNYTIGTGADGVMDLYVGTTNSFAAATHELTMDHGTGTTQVGRIQPRAAYAITTFWDDIMVKASAIGDVCD